MKKIFTFLFAGISIVSNLSAQGNKVIPVVFHILHEYGSENITDAQVQDAVRILNEDFQGRNPDTSQVILPYKPLIADCNIEFRLATKDPDGNCTNGIERIYTSKTNQAGDSSKINQWPRDMYLNIWVVKSIGQSGIAAYTYYPSVVGPLQWAYLDGTVIVHNYVGSIGTGSPGTSRILTHELGHYLELAHPGINCDDGDGISDTPPTGGTNLPCTATPPLYPEWRVCDTAVIENVQNFMFGSYCMRMFTPGQAAKMNTTLNNFVARRNNLWTTANLLATGTDSLTFANPPTCVPKADFSANKRYVCQGGTVNFTDRSWNANATSWSWTFSNGTPSSSISQNPTVAFNTWGWQEVTLRATNAAGADSLTRTDYIFVSPPWSDYWATFTEDFETASTDLWIPDNVNEDETTGWHLTDTAYVSATHSVMLDARGVYRTTKFGFISPAVDLSSCSNMSLNFKYACATQTLNAADITETLRIYLTTNCGATWIIRQSYNGINLANNGFASPNLFVPTTNSFWTNASVSIPMNYMQPNVRFKFEYTTGDFSNAIYIDDINLTGTLSMWEPVHADFNLEVFPNPSASGEISISYVLPYSAAITISLIDLLGQEQTVIRNKDEVAGEKMIPLNSEDLSPGMYMVKISDGRNFQVKKLMISR
jgi:PKD repeat protein